MPDAKNTFLDLWDTWKCETAHFSFINTRHPAWQQMVQFGDTALPWAFGLLVVSPDHGLCSLIAEIRGERPGIKPEDRGHTIPVIRAYIKLGRQLGYLGAERKFVPESLV